MTAETGSIRSAPLPPFPSPQNVDEFCGDKTSGRRSQRTECHRDPTTHTRCSTNIHLYEASNNTPTNTTNIHTGFCETESITFRRAVGPFD